MPTPFENLWTAAQAMMTAVDAASPTNIAAAPSHYGTDFRITPGEAVYQVQIRPAADWMRSNIAYPRARAIVAIHHYRNGIANERSFLHVTMAHFVDSILNPATWAAQAGIYQIEPDAEPELSEGERVGNVISFRAEAVVLLDPA